MIETQEEFDFQYELSLEINTLYSSVCHFITIEEDKLVRDLYLSSDINNWIIARELLKNKKLEIYKHE